MIKTPEWVASQLERRSAYLDAIKRRLATDAAVPAVPANHFLYRELPAGEVAEQAKRVADNALPLVCADLGLDPLRVRWFGRADELDRAELAERAATGQRAPWKAWTDGPCAGRFSATEPDAIWLHPGGRVRDLLYRLAHEAKHAHQYRALPLFSLTKEQAEQDADEYATKWVAWLDAESRLP